MVQKSDKGINVNSSLVEKKLSRAWKNYNQGHDHENNEFLRRAIICCEETLDLISKQENNFTTARSAFQILRNIRLLNYSSENNKQEAGRIMKRFQLRYPALQA